MKCPNCGKLNDEAKVIDSRPYKQTIRRRRECTHCKKRWNTYEVTENEFMSDYKKTYIPWTKGELETIVKMYQEGKTKTEIAKILGRTRMSVSRRLDKLTETGEYFQLLDKCDI